MWQRVTLAQLTRLRQWRTAERRHHRLECEAWEAVLTLWLLGWTGWLPALMLDAVFALPLCVGGVLAPQLYVYWRTRAFAAGQLNCCWLQLFNDPP